MHIRIFHAIVLRRKAAHTFLFFPANQFDSRVHTLMSTAPKTLAYLRNTAFRCKGTLHVIYGKHTKKCAKTKLEHLSR